MHLIGTFVSQQRSVFCNILRTCLVEIVGVRLVELTEIVGSASSPPRLRDDTVVSARVPGISGESESTKPARAPREGARISTVAGLMPKISNQPRARPVSIST
jgi:hypothetical protein